jgi:putative ABC transport system permease protein
MLFFEVIFKNLLGRRLQSALTVAGLAASVAATTSLLTIAWNFADSAAEYYASRGVDIVVVRAGVAERITSSLNAALAERLAALPGVSEVDGSLTEMVSLSEGGLIGIPLHGLDSRGFSLAQVRLQAGRELRPGDRLSILLGASLARSLNKRPGDTVQVEGQPFQVVGVFESANAWEANTLVAPLTDVQELMDRAGQVSEFQIRVAPSMADAAAVRRLCRRIESLRDDDRKSLGFKAQTTRQFVDTDMETRLAQAMAWGTTAVAITLSTLGMMNTMLMSVVQRTKELGLLRAIGWPRVLVLKMILGESMLLSLMGALGGSLIAGTLVRVLAAWSVTRSIVRPDISLRAAFLGLGLALLAGLIGACYPAYRAASVSPTEALRYE